MGMQSQKKSGCNPSKQDVDRMIQAFLKNLNKGSMPPAGN